MMALTQAVTILMIEDDEGHARLIEKNIRRAGVSNEIVHLRDGTVAVEFLFGQLREEMGKYLAVLPPEVGGKLGGGFAALKSRYEYKEFGGGPLLGIKGACIICHGSSDARAIKNALRVAAIMAEDRIAEEMAKGLAAVPTA